MQGFGHFEWTGVKEARTPKRQGASVNDKVDFVPTDEPHSKKCIPILLVELTCSACAFNLHSHFLFLPFDGAQFLHLIICFTQRLLNP